MPIEQSEFEKLETIVEQHLEKLRTERERFRELMEGLDVAEGPIDWQHTESVANRLHNLYMGAENISLVALPKSSMRSCQKGTAGTKIYCSR